MSASWSWKSSGDTAVVRKTDDGLEPGAAIVAINNNTNALQYITGSGSLTVDSSSTPGTTKLALASNVVEFVSNSATVLSQSIVSNTLLTSYSGLALPIENGGTANTSIPTTVTASRYSAWDSNGNTFADGYIAAETFLSQNTVLTAASITGIIYCISTAQAAFTIVLPDIEAGNSLTQGYVTKIINVSPFNIQVNTQNAPVSVTAQCIAGTTMTVSAILGNGSVTVGAVVSGAFITGSPTITTVLQDGPVIFVASCSGTSMIVTSLTSSRRLIAGLELTGTGVTLNTTIVSGPSTGGVGTYVVSISQTFTSRTVTGLGKYVISSTQNFTYQTCTLTPSSSIPIASVAPNTSSEFTFVNPTNAPYWNYISIPGYNGATTTYPFVCQTTSGAFGAGQALYLNPAAVNLTTATQTTATTIYVEYGDVGTGWIFLPDPATIPIGTTYEIIAVSANWFLYGYQSRAYWDSGGKNGVQTQAFVGGNNYNFYTSSYQHPSVTAICVSNSSAVNFASWEFSVQTLIASTLQESNAQAIQITLAVVEIVTSFLGGPFLTEAATPALSRSNSLPRYCDVPYSSLTTQINMPSSVKTGVIAEIFANNMATNSVNYLQLFTSSIFKNFSPKIIPILSSTGATIALLFPGCQGTLTYTNGAAYVYGYIAATTLTVTTVISGGLIISSTTYPGKVYAYGYSNVITITTQLSGSTGGVGTYTVANSPAVNIGSVGSPVKFCIDPNDLQQFTWQALGVLDAVAGNIVTNNYAPASQSIVSSNSTTFLDSTTPHVNVVTGSSDQFVMLPITSTIPLGFMANLTSVTSGKTTVQVNNGSNVSAGVLIVLTNGSKATATCIAKNNTLSDWTLDAIGPGGVTQATSLVGTAFTVSGKTTFGLDNAIKATFTADCIAGTTLLVTAVSAGTLAVGQIISGPFINGSPTIVTSPGGGVGSYTLSSTQNFTTQTCQSYNGSLPTSVQCYNGSNTNFDIIVPTFTTVQVGRSCSFFSAGSYTGVVSIYDASNTASGNQIVNVWPGLNVTITCISNSGNIKLAWVVTSSGYTDTNNSWPFTSLTTLQPLAFQNCSATINVPTGGGNYAMDSTWPDMIILHSTANTPAAFTIKMPPITTVEAGRTYYFVVSTNVGIGNQMVVNVVTNAAGNALIVKMGYLGYSSAFVTYTGLGGCWNALYANLSLTPA